jgi:hypothetical protein
MTNISSNNSPLVSGRDACVTAKRRITNEAKLNSYRFEELIHQLRWIAGLQDQINFANSFVLENFRITLQVSQVLKSNNNNNNSMVPGPYQKRKQQ